MTRLNLNFLAAAAATLCWMGCTNIKSGNDRRGLEPDATAPVGDAASSDTGAGNSSADAAPRQAPTEGPDGDATVSEAGSEDSSAVAEGSDDSGLPGTDAGAPELEDAGRGVAPPDGGPAAGESGTADPDPSSQPDASVPEDDASVGASIDADPCSSEGALRCVRQGAAAQEVCRAGFFIATTPCGAGQVCDSRADVNPGSCATLSDACVGNEGAAVCAGAELHTCSEDSIAIRSESCASERHCQQGLPAGRCASCLTGTFHCEGRQLQRCADDGSEWEDHKECASEALCNESAHACIDSACLPGGKTCQSDTLMVCSQDQTGYQKDEECRPGLCDPVALECDQCVPQERACNAAGDGVRVCDDEGQGYDESSCPGNEPHCVGAGSCVQCTAANQCGSDTPCQKMTCDAGSCGKENIARGEGSCVPSTAASGVCDGAGGCVECVPNNGNCSGQSPHCVAGFCRPCAEGSCAAGSSCARASDCSSSKCAAGSCRPACSGSCAVGQSCVANDDCTSGTCDEVTSTCVETCNTVTISDASSYNVARECSVIQGDLFITYDAEPTTIELPRLIRVVGSIANDFAVAPIRVAAVERLSLPKLTSVGEDVDLTRLGLLSLSLPELSSVTGVLRLHQMAPETVSAPKLQEVGGFDMTSSDPFGTFGTTEIDLSALREAGSFSLGRVNTLTTLQVSNIQSVGQCNFQDLALLPYYMVEDVVEASTTCDVVGVGCCLLSSIQQVNCADFDYTLCDLL